MLLHCFYASTLLFAPTSQSRFFFSLTCITPHSRIAIKAPGSTTSAPVLCILPFPSSKIYSSMIYMCIYIHMHKYIYIFIYLHIYICIYSVLETEHTTKVSYYYICVLILLLHTHTHIYSSSSSMRTHKKQCL
jgi:hypothetical protein